MRVEPAPPPPPEEPLDILWDVDVIARLINRTPKATYHLLLHGKLPGKKVGSAWYTTRAALRAFFTPSPAG